jgi:hypothetical protein
MLYKGITRICEPKFVYNVIKIKHVYFFLVAVALCVLKTLIENLKLREIMTNRASYPAAGEGHRSNNIRSMVSVFPKER